jgi:hypothetical protein
MEGVLASVLVPESDGNDSEPANRHEKARIEFSTMGLTAALLVVAAQGLSFATPGHRCGRSLQRNEE